MRQFAVTLYLLLLLSWFSQAQSSLALIQALQHYVGSEHERKSTAYTAALVDLRDDGSKEAIAYLSSTGWCGTGGCTLLVLAPSGASYKLITKTPIVRLPIRVLTTKTNGWHDLSVVVGGGGCLLTKQSSHSMAPAIL